MFKFFRGNIQKKGDVSDPKVTNRKFKVRGLYLTTEELQRKSKVVFQFNPECWNYVGMSVQQTLEWSPGQLNKDSIYYSG